MAAAIQAGVKKVVDIVNTLNATEELSQDTPLTHALHALRATFALFHCITVWWDYETSSSSTQEKEKEVDEDRDLPAASLSANYSEAGLLIDSQMEAINEAIHEFVDMLGKRPPVIKEGSNLFRLACETGYSGSFPRRWFPTEPRWRVWVSPKDTVTTLHSKLLTVCRRGVSMRSLLHAPTPAVRLSQTMKGLDPALTLEENGITPNSIIRFHNGMAD